MRTKSLFSFQLGDRFNGYESVVSLNVIENPGENDEKVGKNMDFFFPGRVNHVSLLLDAENNLLVAVIKELASVGKVKLSL